jgi:AraC-like DNA-binding protein
MTDPNGQNPVHSSSLIFSTATLPARDRLPVWREVFGQTMVRLDIEPVKGTPFCAEGALCALPGAALASVTASPIRVSRTPRLIAEDAVDMVFLVTADAPLHIVQRGREQMLQAGDAIFVRGNERSTIQCRSTTRFTNISVPINDLMPLLAGHDDLSMTVVNRQNDGFDLLMNYASLLQARQKPLPDELGRIAAAHIRDLMAATIGTDPDCNPRVGERGGVRVARLRAIKADVARYLCEPTLSIDKIAARHGISPRYVRKLFREDQTTFSEFTLALRLERSRQLLRSPTHATSTVTSIAHTVGFNDLSYFNRTFRRRYGITPSELRNDVGKSV